MKKLTTIQNKLVTLIAVRQRAGLDVKDAETLMGLPKMAIVRLAFLLEKGGIVELSGSRLSLRPDWVDRVQLLEGKRRASQEKKPVATQIDVCELARELALGGKKK